MLRRGLIKLDVCVCILLKSLYVLLYVRTCEYEAISLCRCLFNFVCGRRVTDSGGPVCIRPVEVTVPFSLEGPKERHHNFSRAATKRVNDND